MNNRQTFREIPVYQGLSTIYLYKYTPTHINNSLFLSKFQYRIRFLEKINYEK